MTHNAWDHVEPPQSYLDEAATLLQTQAETKIDQPTQEELYHTLPASHWNKFYSSHENKFFKDRKWLGNEFPELIQLAKDQHVGDASIFEIGCGAGNTVFPLLQRNKNPHLHIFACDYSSEAVGVVKSNPLYKLANGEDVVSGTLLNNKTSDQDDLEEVDQDHTVEAIPTKPTGKVTAFVWDLSSPSGPPTDQISESSLDIIVLIFVLSALHPREWDQAVSNCHRLLKPGGLILFRDYGRYDLPQLRFKKGRMLDDNFYVRGDGTRVYFFTQDELRTIFKATDDNDDTVSHHTSSTSAPSAPLLFNTVQMAVDRRMLVNRKENKQMYRCWMQAKFVKR